MRMPTAEELERAWREIDADGPMAETTLALSTIAIKDNRLSGVIKRIADQSAIMLACETLPRDLILLSIVQGAVISGLNYGLRIAGAREAASAAGETKR